MNILSSLLDFICGKISSFTSKITDIEGKLSNAVVIKSYSYQYQVASGGALSITANNFGATTPAGYLPLAVRRATTGSNWCYITAMLADGTGTGTMLAIHNVGTATISGTATIRVAYIRSSLADVL